MSGWRQYTLSIHKVIWDRKTNAKRTSESTFVLDGEDQWRTEGSCHAGRAKRGRDGWFALQFCLASEWGRFQGMCEFGFPFQSLNSLRIIYPFPSSFVSFYPVVVEGLEANDIHLIKMYCGRRCWYCDHISSDGTSYTRCSKRKKRWQKRGGSGVDHSQEMRRRKRIEVRTFFQSLTRGSSL
jgi:hypothetical protein